jgi:hypothetical protein
MGVLTLGIGLGIALAIAATSTTARHGSAVGREVSCVTIPPPNEALSCTNSSSRAISEMVLSFPEVQLPQTFDRCMTKAMETVWPMKPITTPTPAQPGGLSLGNPGPSESLDTTAERDIVACGGPHNVPY